MWLRDIGNRRRPFLFCPILLNSRGSPLAAHKEWHDDTSHHGFSAAPASSGGTWCGRWRSGAGGCASPCGRPDLAGHLQPMGNVGQIMPVQANLRYPDSVAQALKGADGVVNLVGILYESGRQSFEKVQAEGPETIARAAQKAGIEQVVHVSAIGADADAEALYARSKAAGEAGVLRHVPGAVILRPSIVFGRRIISSTSSPRWRGSCRLCR